VDVLEAWEDPIWEESHGMVQPENIDSGHSNFQLDTRSSLVAIVVIWIIYSFISH
jgi:hypothetical protein